MSNRRVEDTEREVMAMLEDRAPAAPAAGTGGAAGAGGGQTQPAGVALAEDRIRKLEERVAKLESERAQGASRAQG